VHMNRRRVLLLIAACGLAAAGIGPARAQDPRGTAAQKEARAWLVLTDRGDAAASWRAAGKPFQNAISADKWGESLKQVRPPLGAVVERSILSTEFPKTFPGAPAGEYALLVFRTSFANKIDSNETVTLQREADGVWRVVGYFIK
jgi:Protein of unknown function (DUF4019)